MKLQNNRDPNQVVLHVWSKFGDSSLSDGRVIMERTSELTHTGTHIYTDAGNDNNWRPKLVMGKKCQNTVCQEQFFFSSDFINENND